MAARIEWRRTPDEQHTGSVELRGVAGTPFIYVHPEDQADEDVASCAGRWWYDHRNATVSPDVQNPGGVYVRGRFSYADYQATRTLWRRLSGWRKFAIGLFGSYRGQDRPGSVFGPVLASSLQVSGQLVYDAWLVLDPAPSQATTYDIHAELWAYARGRCTRRAAIGMGRSVTATAHAFDGTTEIGVQRASARIRSPRQRDSHRATHDYTITVPGGTAEHRIGRATTGPGYSIGSGSSWFVAWGEVTFTVSGPGDTVIAEPPAEGEGD